MNENLENRGWQAMEALLDQEMPVKKRKRKLPFWFFLLFGAGWLLVIFMLQLNLFPIQKKTHQIPLNKPSLSIANSPAELEMECPEEKATFSPQPIDKPNPGNSQVQSLSPIQYKNKAFEVLPPDPQWIFPPLTKQLKPIPVKTKFSPLMISAKDSSNLRVYSLSDVPFLPAQNPHLDFDAIRSIENRFKSNPQWTNFLEGGFFNSDQSLLSGNYLYYQKALLLGPRKRWLIQAGLGWKHQVVTSLSKSSNDDSFESAQNTTLDAAHSSEKDRSSDPTSNPGVFADSLMNESTDSQFDPELSNHAVSLNSPVDLHYASLPIRIGYRWKARWEVQLGASFDLLMAQKHRQSLDGVVLSTNFSGGFSNDNQLPDFNKFNFSVNSALYYRLNPKWSITYRYEHGLSNILKHQSQKAYLRRNALGVRWEF